MYTKGRGADSTLGGERGIKWVGSAALVIEWLQNPSAPDQIGARRRLRYRLRMGRLV